MLNQIKKRVGLKSASRRTQVRVLLPAKSVSRDVIVKVNRSLFGRLNWNKMTTDYIPGRGEIPGTSEQHRWGDKR